MENKRFGARALCLCFLLLIFALALLNCLLLKKPLGALLRGEIPFEKFTAQVQNTYQQEFWHKNDFLTLNGGYARATGTRTHNGIVKLNNGMLGPEYIAGLDMTGPADKIQALNEFLGDRDIPFLYALAPSEVDTEDQLLPAGIHNAGNSNADQLLAELNSRQVQTLDLRAFVSATPEMVEAYFYSTDHHWNAEGAFLGFQQLCARLQEDFPNEDICGAATQREQWTLHTVPRQFLGTRGRRVGPVFGGIDDLIYLTPGFETADMTCIIPETDGIYCGDFVASNLRMERAEMPENCYRSNGYTIYIGEDYMRVSHHNPNAPCEKKLLLLKDSFALPVQAFLSTVFRDVEVLDTRYLNNCAAAQWILISQPDMVIQLQSPITFDWGDIFAYGIEYVLDDMTPELLVEMDRLRITAGDNAYANESLYDQLEENQVYTVTADDIIVHSGTVQGISVAVYDFDQEACVFKELVALDPDHEGPYQWHLSTLAMEDSANIILYPGIPGDCAGADVSFVGLRVYRGMPNE